MYVRVVLFILVFVLCVGMLEFCCVSIIEQIYQENLKSCIKLNSIRKSIQFKN